MNLLKKIFGTSREKFLYFLFDSKKPFFVATSITIIGVFCFSIVSIFIIYNNTGKLYKPYEVRASEPLLAEKKILLDADDGELIIKKQGNIELDFKTITVNDNYFNEEIELVFPSDYSDYFEEEVFIVDDDFICEIYVTTKEEKTILKIKEKTIFGILKESTNSAIKLSFKPPKEVYKKIVVLDAGHGGMDFGINNGIILEKDVVLKICKKLEALFKPKDDVKVYLIRNFDEYIQDEKRVYFANHYADLFLSVHLNGKDMYNFSEQLEINCLTHKDISLNISAKDGIDIFSNAIVKYNKYDTVNAVEKSESEYKNNKVFTVVVKLGYGEKYIKDSAFFDKVATGLYDGINKTLNFNN